MAIKRYIITGSRDFGNRALVERVVTEIVMQAHKADERVVIVHGACPTGADHYADETAKKLKAQGYPVDVEEHPADWEKHGKAAGPMRNSHVTDLGAFCTMAFWDGVTPGTLDTIQKSVKKKIVVHIFPG